MPFMVYVTRDEPRAIAAALVAERSQDSAGIGINGLPFVRNESENDPMDGMHLAPWNASRPGSAAETTLSGRTLVDGPEEE